MNEFKKEIFFLSLGHFSICYFNLMGSIGMNILSYYYNINQPFTPEKFQFFVVFSIYIG